MDECHTEAYNGWSITVTAKTGRFATSAAERFTLSVVIVQLQEPHRRFAGAPRSAVFLDRCNAIQEGIAAAKTLIETLTTNGESATG